jgi:histidinol-phosphate/aromatic aminotransferase/cobyric acid decarboxylase-like protein
MDRNSDRQQTQERALVDAELSDGQLRALSSPHVRHTLRWLDSYPQTTLAELTDAVAGFEGAQSETVVTAEGRDRIRTQLYHTVLPKLEALGFVDFDVDERTVERAEIPPGVAQLLELSE